MIRLLSLLCCCALALPAATQPTTEPSTDMPAEEFDLKAIDFDIQCGRYEKACSDIEGLLARRDRLSDQEAETLRDRWDLAAMRKTLAVTEPVARYVALTDLDEHPLFQRDTPRKRLVSQEIDEIKNQRLVRKEQAVIAAYKGLKQKERRYSNFPSRLGDIAESYRNLATRFPDSPTGAKAAADAKRLSQQITDR